MKARTVPKFARLTILVMLLLTACAMPITQPQTLPSQQAPAAQGWREALGITKADTDALIDLLAPKGPKVETEVVAPMPVAEMTNWERWYLAEAPQAPTAETTVRDRWYLDEAQRAPTAETTVWERWYLAEAPQAPVVEMSVWEQWYRAEAAQVPPPIRDQWYLDVAPAADTWVVEHTP